MNIGTIVGASIGMPVGGVVGFLNPILLNSVYSEEWKKSYERNGAILFLTTGYGAIGGALCGAVGGTISHNIINDSGVIGGLIGSAFGGTVGGVYCIYTVFLDKQSNP
jgi:hypothetical protein